MIDRRSFLAGSVSLAGLSAFAGPAIAASKGSGHKEHGRVDALTRVLDGVAEQILKEYPDQATFLGVDTGIRGGLHTRLHDRSLDGIASRNIACAERLKKLTDLDKTSFSEAEAITWKTTVYAHELAQEGGQFAYGDNMVLNGWQADANSPYAASQSSGSFAIFPDFLDSMHKIEATSDGEAYLSRLSAMARNLAGETERLRHDAGLGVVAPDFILDTTLKNQQAYLAQSPASWGLVSSLAKRAAEKNIAGDWESRARTICEREVGPALAAQAEALKALRAKASSDAGCWKLPDGDAFYSWLLRAGTTTSMKPDEVHKLGLEKVKEITARMDVLLKAQTLTQGSVGERMTALGKDPRFLFPNTDAGRADLLAYLNQVVAGVRTRLPDLFDTHPKADLVIKRVPPEIEAGAPGGYELDGPIDGSRPASYYINLHDTADWPKFTLPTLCYHEGLPGHVWQGVYMRNLPLVRTLLAFNAYIEGWALYSEQLADEIGLYENDPFGRLGFLQAQQFRACRLVVDTGLHAKRWTRDQALKWMLEQNGGTENDTRNEIDRYCSWPGQACGYQTGRIEIERLRTKAKAELGTKFDLRSYNDAIVTAGSVPLALLNDIVEGYVTGRKG
jgi:uncharacterized protein (DUF885 family)